MPVETEPALFVAGSHMGKLTSGQLIMRGFLFLEGEKISTFGEMGDPALEKIRESKQTVLREISAEGKLAIPAFCDSHTHLVFAGSGEQEYRDRIMGLSYEEIAKRGGGILNSAKNLQSTSEDDLYLQSLQRFFEDDETRNRCR